MLLSEGGWLWWNPSSDAGSPWATVRGALPPGPQCTHLGDGKGRTHPTSWINEGVLRGMGGQLAGARRTSDSTAQHVGVMLL